MYAPILMTDVAIVLPLRLLAAKQAGQHVLQVSLQDAICVQGWWHYAVALDRSLTVMRNFYSAGDNAASMVQLVLKVASEARSQKPANPRME